MHFSGVLAPREHALSIELRAEPGHMARPISRADRVQRVIPRLQYFAGGRVEVVAGRFVPHRQLVPGEPDSLY